MAEDHDLGTARGHIKIDADVDTDAAAARLAAMRGSMEALRQRGESLSNGLQKTEASMQRLQSAALQAQGAMVASGAAVGSLASRAAQAASSIAGTSISMEALAKSSLKAVQTVSGFSSASGVLSKLGRSILGVDEAVNNLGSSLGKTLAIAGGIGSAFGLIDGVGRRLGVTAASATLLGRASMGIRRIPLILAAGSVAASAMTRRLTLASGASALLIRRLQGLSFNSLGMNGIARGLEGIHRVTGNASAAILRFRDNVNRRGTPGATFLGGLLTELPRIAKGVGTSILGLALIKSGLSKIAPAAKLAAIALLAVTAAGGAMSVIGPIVVGLVGSLKQIAGVGLILPGVVASLGAIGVVAKMAGSGLSSALKAGMSEANKFSAALKDVPDSMKGIARSIQANKSEFEGFKDLAASTVFKGLDKSLDQIIKKTMPRLRIGVAQIGSGLNVGVQGVSRYALSAKGANDISSVMGSAGRVAANFGAALGPALSALMTMARVGSKVFADLTGGIGSAAQRLEKLTSVAANSGAMEDRIRRGVTGFQNLVAAIRDASVGVFQFFKVFHSGDGSTALESMARGAKKFRDSMESSANGGALQSISVALKRMADNGAKVLSAVVSNVGKILNAWSGFADSMSSSFGSTLVTVVGVIGSVVAKIGELLSALGPIGSYVGSVLALGVAFKAMMFILPAIIAMLKLLIGPIALLRGFGGILTGLGIATTAAAAKMSRIGGAMTGAAGAGLTAMGRVTSFLMGPWGLAFAAAGLAIYATVDAYKKLHQATKDQIEYEKFLGRSGSVYGRALQSSVGDVNDSTFKAKTTGQIAEVRQGMERAQKNRPSAWAGFSASSWNDRSERSSVKKDLGLKGYPSSWSAEDQERVTKEFDRRKKFTQDKGYSGKSYEYSAANDNANKAKETLEVFDKLKLSNEDMAAAVTGSKGAYDNLIGSLQNAKATGQITENQFNLTKDALDFQRSSFEKAQKAFNAQTPGLASLAQGLKLVGEAGDDASQKLKGLKLALDGMFGSSNVMDAAIETADAIKKVSEASASLSVDKDKLRAGFDPRTNQLDAGNSEVQKVYQSLKPIGDDLVNVAANGGNVAEALAKWQPELDKIREKSGATDAEWRRLLETARAVPNEITMIMKSQGLSETDAWITAIAWKTKQLGDTPVRVMVNGQADIDKLKEIGATVSTLANNPNEIDVKFSPEALAKLKPEIRKVLESGVVLPVTTAKPATPAKPGEPAKPGAPVPAPVQTPVPAPGAAAPTTPQGQIDATRVAGEKLKPKYETSVAVNNWQPSQQVVDDLRHKLDELVKGNYSVSINIRSNQQNLVKILGDLAQVSRNTKIEIDLSGLDGLKAKLDEVRQKIIEFVDAMKPKIMELVAAFTDMANAANGVLDTMASTAYQRGAKLVDDFAAGIRSGVNKVKGATMTVAVAATDPLPNSPAKIGPLSGKGYTDARGRKLSEDFASGILAGQGSVANASLKIGGAAVPQSDIASAIQAILAGGPANMEALRKYGLGPTSDETLAISDAGKKGVTATELEMFLKSGDFQASGLAGKLDPSSELVNNLRKLRDNDKLVSDLVMKNHGVLVDPKEEYEKQFKAGKNAADKITGPLKRAVSGFSDILRGFMGQPLAGLSGQEDGQAKYMVDSDISDYEVARNLAKRKASEIAQNNQSGTAVATASGSLSDANTALAKNASDIAEATAKIQNFQSTGDDEKDKKTLDDYHESLKKLKDETANLTKAQVAAQNGLNTAIQTFQQQGGQTSQIPQLTDAKKKEQDQLDALTKAQTARADFKASGDEAKDSEQQRTLDQAVADAQTAYTNSKNATAQVAALMKTTVTPTLTGPGSPGGGVSVGQTGTYGLANGSTEMPQWLKDLGAKYGVTPSTYADHQTTVYGDGGAAYGYVANPQQLNRGVDWNGSPENMLAFAKALQGIQSNALEQIIYMDPKTGEKVGRAGTRQVGPGTNDPNYYASNWGGHDNHVHTRFNAPVAWNGQPVAQPPTTQPPTTQPPAAQPPATGQPQQKTFQEFWDKIAAKESGGNWGNADTGGNGHYGGLQFSPSTWAAFGGKEFADMPHLATRDQQMEIANRTAFTGYNGQKPQGLGAWEVITNGSTAGDGITVNSKPALDQIVTNTGVTAGATAPAQNTLESLLAGNASLSALMAQAADPNTSRQDTGELLQQIDKYTAANPNDADLVNARKTQIMSDKGIKDAPDGLDLGPIDKAIEMEGKVQSLVDGVLKVAKWPMDVYNSAQSAFENGSKAFEMLVRGFSGTKDVNDFVDQMQATWGSVMNVFQTVTGIVGSVSDVFSTVSDIVTTITTLMKTGAEIAGAIAEVASVVGSVASVVSGVIGGVAAAVGSIDEMIDMGQEAWKIASRYLGKALSWIAGGLGGSMQGTVRALYDSNDQSLKFWNADNPDMKTTYGLDPSKNNDPLGTNKPLDDQIKNQQNINIYANPNASASEIMQEQQYAVRTAGLGSNANF